METIRFGFIGAGKVGFSLGKYLNENKINVIGYYSKNPHSSKEAAFFTNTKQFQNLNELVNNSDVIFITTPDSQIQQVYSELKQLNIRDKVICHCSGSISSTIFSNVKNYGAYAYSIHPMFAISSKYNSYKDFQKAFITIEGDEKFKDYFVSLFKNLGNKVGVISSENKILYHAACVTVSNLVLGLINKGVNFLETCDFSREDALNALFPLIENNVENIKKQGLVDSLTGPVERGDLCTIVKHCEVLNENDKELYKLLSRDLLEVAKIKNENRDYKKLQNYLEER